MTVKDQVQKVKNNWLLILVPIVLLFLFFGLSGRFSLFSGSSSLAFTDVASSAYERSTVAEGYAPAPYAGVSAKTSAAPVVDQMIAKTARVETEVERGGFLDAEATLKSVVESSGAVLLEQDVRTYDEGLARIGAYRIKVDAGRYDALVSQLQMIGELDAFAENAQDVTQAYTDVGAQLENEKERLERYNQMYQDATLVDDKIDISDRIFNQENTIAYLEGALRDVGSQVVYSTIDVTLTEKASGYAELTFVKLSELVQGFVGSLSAVVYLLVISLPWALGVWLVVFVIRKLRRRR